MTLHRSATILWATSLGVLSFGLSMTTILSGCKQEAQAAREVKPPKVTVTTPARADVTTYQEFTGYTKAFETVEIRARVKGFLHAVHFEPSAKVTKGQLLFEIDPAPYQATLDRTIASLGIAKAERDKTKWSLDRIQELYERDAANEREVQDAKADLDLAEAKIAAALAEIKAAELDLGYCQVISPIEGRISRSLVDAGNLVGAGESTLLTTVAGMNPTYAFFNVGEEVVIRFLNKLKENNGRTGDVSKVYLGLLGSDDYPFEGIIDYIDNTVDRTTGTVPLRGVFKNESWDLYPGLFARIRLPGKVLKDAVLVRDDAVGTDLGGKYIYVVSPEDNVVHQTRVLLGPLLDNGWRVVSEGMDGSEQYIAVGLMRARPDMPIEPEMVDHSTFPPVPELSENPTEQPQSPESTDDDG